MALGLFLAPARGAETSDTGLARFYHQQINWHSCQQGSQDTDGQALDRPGALQDAYALWEFSAGDHLEIGPFGVDTRPLPHFVPNAGLRLTAAGRVLAYTGDTGPSPELVDLARDADVFLAEATYPEQVPTHSARYLSSALQAGEYATRAGVGRLLLTHLWPGTPPEAALAAARRAFPADVAVAEGGVTIHVGG